jgi:diguanylate cyclase (GGDEF)-like protein/putative nucleotidyltransferase with HDIG domain
VLEDADAAVRRRLGAPVFLGEELWGYVGVVAGADAEIGAGVMTRLELFGRMASTAVASAAARERLVEQATTDPLTRLANHRAFQERLRTEVARARRHGRPLALAIIDLDHFKSVNDALGHQAGNDVLQLVARTLSGLARATDTVGRLGGDEFAMLLPETDVEGAQALAERARECLRRQTAFPMPLTISAGVAMLPPGGDAAGLLGLADGALYRAKAAGRDAVRIQAPGEAEEEPGEESADRLARTQARVALRALARVIDAKDPSTREHALRVADLASALARELEWPEPRIALLHEAALLHDVGKVVVPDAILAKPSGLDPAEREQVEHHAAIGASIAAEVLTSEQAGWIRHHHERPDATGYPDGLAGDDVPEGAQLIGLADAWDAMTTGGHRKAPKAPEAALEECRRLAGSQFAPRVVEALVRHHAAQAAGR